MESKNKSNIDQKKFQPSVSNSQDLPGNEGNDFNNHNNEHNVSEIYQNYAYSNLENTNQENDLYGETFNSSYQNYSYSNQIYGQSSPKESVNTDTNKATEGKPNLDLGDKPWHRAAKDPTIIQKGTELFVGNLSMDTVEEDLYESFQECGEIIDVSRINKILILNIGKLEFLVIKSKLN